VVDPLEEGRDHSEGPMREGRDHGVGPWRDALRREGTFFVDPDDPEERGCVSVVDP
jgi:hypothetical protein